jgi:hypothetical protein
MKNIAICFCGFNRQSLLTINLKNIFEKYYFYNSNIKLLDVYYHTWDSLSEDNDNKIDIEKIKESFLKNGIDNVFLKSEIYDIKKFIYLLKLNNINIKKKAYLDKFPMLNRFLSCIYSWSSVYSLINKNYDYIFHLRLDYGLINSIFKKFDINQLGKKSIIGGHTSGHNKIDPRFIFGHFNDMMNFKDLFNNFFNFNLDINNRDHVLLREYITNVLKCKILPIRNMIDNNNCLYNGQATFIKIQSKEYNEYVNNIYYSLKMKKKCAICLRGCIDKIKSGHFSNIESIYKEGKYINIDSIFKSIKMHIIDCNTEFDFDFFIHCWNPDIKDKLCKVYNPKDYEFESQIPYKNLVKRAMDGQKLGISKSLNIMINFSERENIKYDKVIVYRPDVILYKDMNLNFYKNDKIYCNSSINEDFHFIMNFNNAKIFKDVNKYKMTFYDFTKNIMKNPLNADNIKCGIHQEVLRKIKMACIDRHNIDRSIFYKYDLEDEEIDLMTHN